MQPILLIVDDEKGTRDGLLLGLEDSFDIYVASNLSEANSILESEPVDIVLTDLRLAGESGMDVIKKAQMCKNPPACIVMTAYGSIAAAVEATRQGAYYFATKPLNLDELEILLKRAVQSRGLEVENKKLKAQLNPVAGLGGLLGKSEVMEAVFDKIRQVAPTKATVLVEGETGTGKELVCRAIHSLSERTGKLVIVNCAALSPQLLESELFGHEKGAFTGALKTRIGRFEEAAGGTLFLDEIGEISSETQVKLLRALSEKTIERVGSNEPINVDVRLVAATNKSLKSLVNQGKFREDLYFRLNVVKLDLPPLRERKEDIIILAQAFLRDLALENAKIVSQFSDQSLVLMQTYSWPGNVRELKTVIEHGVVMCNGPVLELKHLPAYILQDEKKFEIKSSKERNIPQNILNEKMEKCGENEMMSESEFNLSIIEKKVILRALSYCHDNKSKAATLLGISRRTLQRKLIDMEDSKE